MNVPDSLPDHRRLGRQLGIFATDEAVGAGLPLWLPRGAIVRGELERFVVELERRHGFHHVYTPELAKRSLYERSGHWAHYRDDMFPPMQVGGEELVLRPMNCPHHILVWQAEPHRDRDLPYRLAELGTMFRNERSGVIGGLSRVRQATLDDGHIFCRPDQIEAEIAGTLELIDHAYRTLGIPPAILRLSRRGTGSKYVADPAMWQRAEDVIRSTLSDLGRDYVEAEGEAAFYGPKIDLQVTDPQGREETLSTVQVDFHLPERFDLWIGHGAGRQRPVMIHRSITATAERMVAHLLEVHDGAFPLWLAPTQVILLPVTGGNVAGARNVRDALRAADVRVELDDRDETLASRVRDAQQQRVPYLAVLGSREAAAGTVAVRSRGQDQPEEMEVGRFVDLVRSRSAERHPG
ncbi:MAG TPA: threonine--tRNA ligase [Acidimicrobiales bacterium]|nr:threonine--tRNA ligase [Acidimicrobiales bacterium]